MLKRIENILLEIWGAIIIFNQWLYDLIAPLREFVGERLGWFMYNLTYGSVWAIEHVITSITPNLKSTFGAVINAVLDHGGPLLDEIEAPLRSFTGKAFAAVTAHLESHGHSSPADWKSLATEAMTDAYTFGLSSAAITAMFEAIFPEKLNTFNAVGPMLKSLAGFDEVTAAVLRPLLRTGISVAAQYDANAKFTPVMPGAQIALTMWARRLLSDHDAQTLLRSAGYAEHWDGSLFNNAYRPLSPRALATMIEDQPFDRPQMKQILEDNSYSPDHVNFMLDEFEYASLKNLRNTLISAAIHAYERGVMDEKELTDLMDEQKWSDQAKKYVMDHALIQRRLTLAQKVELNVVPLVAAGLMPHEQGLQQMEAAGMQPWYADLEITLATTKATLTAAKLEASEEKKNKLIEQRNLTRAAIAEYQTGRIDTPALALALAKIGLDPVVLASITAVQEAKRDNLRKLTFGLHLPPDQSALLQQQVGAIEQQTKDQLINHATAKQMLENLKIPPPEITALLARWGASLKKSPGAAIGLNPVTGAVETNVIKG